MRDLEYNLRRQKTVLVINPDEYKLDFRKRKPKKPIEKKEESEKGSEFKMPSDHDIKDSMRSPGEQIELENAIGNWNVSGFEDDNVSLNADHEELKGDALYTSVQRKLEQKEARDQEEARRAEEARRKAAGQEEQDSEEESSNQ